MRESVIERLNDLTRGKGPDKCIDCTGLESHVCLKHNEHRNQTIQQSPLAR
jgi:hypothetical protein